MDINVISQFIGSIGFPICCCIYLFKSNDELRKTIEANTEAIRELKFMIHEHNVKEDGHEL